MDVLLKDPGNGSDEVPQETRVRDCTMITVTADLTWSGPEAREVQRDADQTLKGEEEVVLWMYNLAYASRS